MFDIFGIKKRRAEKKRLEEEKHLEEIRIKKQNYQERKKLIESYLSVYNKEQEEIAKKQYHKNCEYADKVNSCCPKCGSKDVIHNIRRTQGEIHGSGSISGSSLTSYGLFSSASHSYVSGSSKIDGKLDTIPINKCNKCGNEWNIEKAKYPNADNIFSTYRSFAPTCLFNRVREYMKLEYNPEDITEECNSLEEKRDKYIEQCQTQYSYLWKYYSDCPRYMVEYAFFQELKDRPYLKDRLCRIICEYKEMFSVDEDTDEYSVDEDTDEYSFEFSDELWEIVKKIIRWKDRS